MFYLDEIKWRSGEDEAYFHPEMVFDLRSLPECGVKGVTAGRLVLCEGPVAPLGTMAIGELGLALTPGRRAGLEAWLGESVVATEVGAFIQELIFNLGDPACLARWRPVRVSGRTLRLRVGDLDVRRRVQVTDPEFRQTLAVERLNYQQWRSEAQAAAQALADAGRTWEQVVGHFANQSMDATDRSLFRFGAPDRHLRNLDYQREHYGIDYHEFIKIDDVRSLPDEGIKPHGSTVTDSFTDTDGTAIGSHTGESGTWVQTLTTDGTTIQTNKASNTQALGTAANRHRLEADLSSGNHYAQGVCTTTDEASVGDSGMQTRFAAGADTAMAGFWQWDGAATEHIIQKVVAGVATGLATGTDNPVSGDTLKLTSDSADLHQCARNGSNTISVTDSAVSSANTRTGIYLRPRSVGVTNTVDAFEAADLAAAAATILPQMMQQGLYASR